MSWNQGRQNQRGFTVVEVMIVLAIAAFIMIIVFLAVPSLRHAARNNERKNDVRLLLALIQEEKSFIGRLPASCSGGDSSCFLNDTKLGMYDNATDNVSWERRTVAADTQPVNKDNADDIHKVVISRFARCDGNQFTGTGATQYNVAAAFLIETLSGYDYACIQS